MVSPVVSPVVSPAVSPAVRDCRYVRPSVRPTVRRRGKIICSRPGRRGRQRFRAGAVSTTSDGQLRYASRTLHTRETEDPREEDPQGSVPVAQPCGHQEHRPVPGVPADHVGTYDARRCECARARARVDDRDVASSSFGRHVASPRLVDGYYSSAVA